MTQRYSPTTWRRVGEALNHRRVTIDRNRMRFSRNTGINYRLTRDIENATRTNFGDDTLADVETAYQLPPGWIAKSLDAVEHGGDPLPIPEDAPEDAGGVSLSAEALAHPVVRAILYELGPGDVPEMEWSARVRLASGAPGHPLVESMLVLPDDPRSPLSEEERTRKAAAAYLLAATGHVALTPEHLADPVVQMILTIPGAPMEALISRALATVEATGRVQDYTNNHQGGGSTRAESA